jgi:lysophospholipase L1-like esterase
MPEMLKEHPRNLLFIGNSLIEFFDWAGRFPSHNVYNLGRAGETVEGLLARLDGAIEKHPSADIVFLQTGLNNVAMEDTGFIDSYRTILKRLSSSYPYARIYVTSLLPTLFEEISPEVITRINESLRTLAQEGGALYLDIHSLILKRGVGDCLLQDGVHLNDTGYEVWAAALEDVIAS